MSLFNKRSTPEQLEEELENISMEDEIATHRVQLAEKRAVIARLKKEYGRNWAQVLGVNKLTDAATLRSFLHGAHRGLSQQSGSFKSHRDLVVPRRNQVPTPLPKMGRLARAQKGGLIDDE